MSGENKGWVGSLAVHAGILAVLVGASWYASRQTGENLEAVDPLIVTLDGIPGKKPGQIGKAPGVAQGDERGVAGGIPRIHLKKLDLEKVEQERNKAVEQATQGATSPAKSEIRSTTKAGPGSPTKLSLDDLQCTVISAVGPSSPWTVAESTTVEAAPSFTRTGESRGD
jgi:hypothetical protein